MIQSMILDDKELSAIATALGTMIADIRYTVEFPLDELKKHDITYEKYLALVSLLATAESALHKCSYALTFPSASQDN